MKMSMSFIKGKNNCFADYTSGTLKKNIHTELSKDPSTVQLLKTKLGSSTDIDLFASHLNHIVPQFCSWFPCLNAFMIYCFNLNWSEYNGYLFPPFRLISRCLCRIEEYKVRKIQAIVSEWPRTSWWMRLVSLLNHPPSPTSKKNNTKTANTQWTNKCDSFLQIYLQVTS